ncbi:hypothetical protein C4D60_Mb07t02240 [Musa balbisiana]|uniref:Uncharacterized protein n=1 Tax=Musa balbisiana TaxID=52838 RepID=A0A4S8JCC9_MUSBA|nr:hypothetical protein C4D60_Mb07t02240 [Musa balbisiana]
MAVTSRAAESSMCIMSAAITRSKGPDLIGVVPVGLGVLGGPGGDEAVTLEVGAEGGRHGGDVGQHNVEAEVDGALAREAEEVGIGESHCSTNLTRMRKQGQTEMPTCMEPLSCSKVRTAAPTGSSTTGESVNRIELERRAKNLWGFDP